MVRQIISLTPEQLNALPPADRARFAEVVRGSFSLLVALRFPLLQSVHLHCYSHHSFFALNREEISCNEVLRSYH